MSRDTKKLLLEMSAGILIYEILLSILAAAFCPKNGYPLMPVIIGLLTGFAADMAMLIHMAYVTEDVISSNNESYATKKTIINSIIRKVLFIALLFIVGSHPQVNALAIIIGAFGLKAGAYLQPLFHKIISGKEDSYGNDENANSKRS